VEITDVRIKLSSGGQPRLLAYCTITLDRCFVVRDVKVIQGNDGPFVAMPSRRPTQRCSSCRARNPLKGRYCSECGAPLHADPSEGDGPAARHVDIAHPITKEMRHRLHERVMAAFSEEQAHSGASGTRVSDEAASHEHYY